MVTFQAGRVALFALVAGMTAACSGEQQDWRSAESADTTEAWQRFLDQHPESELVNEARSRILQLQERRDFQHADRIGTVEAYRDFLTYHPSGLWSERARIRIESFSLGSTPRIAPPTPEEAASFGDSGVRALRLATATVPQAGAASTQSAIIQPAALPSTAAAPGPDTAPAVPAEAAAEASGPEGGAGRAVPGEPAQADADVVVAPPATPGEIGPQPAYGIQLGAFGSEASADREWRRLQVRFGPELGSLSPRIVLAESDSRPFYRLQVPASGEAQARAICDSLREQSQACIPVVPR